MAAGITMRTVSALTPRSIGTTTWSRYRRFAVLTSLIAERDSVHRASSFTLRTIGCSVFKRGFNKVLVGREGPPITLNDIKKVLTEHEVSFEEGFTCLIIDCNACHACKRIGKLFVNMTTGDFVCLKCASCGSWDDLAAWLALRKAGEIKPLPKTEYGQTPHDKEVKDTELAYYFATPLGALSSETFSAITSKFEIEAIGVDVFVNYEVSVTSDQSRLLLPLYSVAGTRIGFHVIHEKKDPNSSCKIETFPRNLKGVVFGWKQLRKQRQVKQIIIVGSPLHVLAIAQQKRSCAISLPDQKSLPLDVLPMLEPFHGIVLWLGSNLEAWDLARKFARKLNERRCHLIRPHDFHPEPLEALKNGIKLSTIIKSAHPVLHKSITTFSSLRAEVFAEFSRIDQLCGVKWTRYPALNRLLKGHRRGELTVLTGQTGSGKTTFMSEYSLDLCMQGVRTLWGSFEVKNTRLAKTMLMQYSLVNLSKSLDQYDYFADQFERLALYFLTFHGSHSIRNVLDAMRHAVYIHDIEHVIVDNLQFMMGISDTTNPSIDKFWKQDIVISSLRQFATVHNCHVTLAIHPRKEIAELLTNMSFYGGAKACQEADNVLILQEKRLHGLRAKKYIEVTKNRFDGDTGIVPLMFDKETCSFAAKPKPKNVPNPTIDPSDAKTFGLLETRNVYFNG